MTAPNSGTVAFRMADRPVLIDCSAKAKQTNGIPELMTPISMVCFQRRASAGPWPRSSISGSRNALAIATRTPAVGSAPNSSTPMRVNRKDEPQIAPSSRKSVAQALLVDRKWTVGWVMPGRRAALGRKTLLWPQQSGR